jgi:predicted CoA-substrate-specific enzyme activase
MGDEAVQTREHRPEAAGRGGPLWVGLDIGSVSAKLVVLDDANAVLENHYVRTQGQPLATARDVLAELLGRVPRERIDGFALTGAGGKLLGQVLGIESINEIVAQSTGTAAFEPGVRTIIEMGGEDSKLIKLEPNEPKEEPRITDFAMNTVCAAGTGSFLDQQAARLGVSIEHEFGELALRSQSPPRIAGRCSVFAKTDMIHLQQEATPDYDIVAGLCHALARNFHSNICRGKDFEKPIAFQGGVAANAGMVKAFEEVLELEPGELQVPEHFASMGAIGAVLAARREGTTAPMPDVAEIDEHLARRQVAARRLGPLEDEGYACETEPEPIRGDEPVEAYLGVDVGSISTNLVLLDKDRRVIAREYLMTAGRPIDAVQRGLMNIGRAFRDRVVVRGASTTGSGRYLTGDFLGADVIKNEITTHATAAAFVHPEVDTIFEIGGQDSKYVSLDHGAVVDFTMNKVCAAGTGSFLEEQAERLGVRIDREFGDRALAARSPVFLGDRCTVFVESSLNHYQQMGVDKDDLIAGLCYSIVYNYLNKVVETRKVGDVILFQGGTAYNRGVRAAFEKVTGKTVRVPPHHDVMGAIGAALIAMEEMAGTDRPSRFKGFDLSDRRYTVESFECHDCPNHCEIKRVTVEGERPLHYGSRCGKFDEEKRRGPKSRLPQLFAERQRTLLSAYPKDRPDRPNGRTVGIPQAAHYFELYPLWKAFFTELGFDVVISRDTNQQIIRRGVGHVAAETCFPIKVAHGHVLDLLDRGVDFLFLPCLVDLETSESGFDNSYACPYVQSVPYFIRSAIDLGRPGVTTLDPVIHMSRGRRHVVRVLAKLAGDLGVPRRAARRAAGVAFAALDRFFEHISRRGREVLESLGPNDVAVAIISRPYNGCDTGLNLNLPEKLREMGAIPVPIDCLPLDDAGVAGEFPQMYWKYGQRILAAARHIRSQDRLHALYVTNFGCGPDSFISKFFEREMQGKPFLTIEIDEHSADGGVITRCEAFLDSLRNVRPPAAQQAAASTPRADYVPVRDRRRTLYVPHMADHGRLLAAVMRRHGIPARPMPVSDQESLEIGRKFTSGRECYPCIITTGDIVKQTMQAEFDPDHSAFLMPKASGPCRFGQYNRFHRMVLDDIGLAHVPLFTLDQGDEYDRSLSQLGAGFRRTAWRGFMLADLLQKVLRHTRPYERREGESDALYRRCLERLEEALEQGGDLDALAREFRAAFDAVPVDRSVPRPKIGIVGEIYVRCNTFANNSVVRRLEELGAEVSLPPMEEWIDYIDHARRRDFLADRNYTGLAMEYVKEWVKELDVRRLSRPFRGAVPHFWLEQPTAAILARASRYLAPEIRGEAVLSIGRAVEYAEHGFAGVVNVAPFNCIPGTIVNALLERFVADHGNLPCLKLQYDGHEVAGESLRIEAFMHQARQAAAAGAPHDGDTHERQRLEVRR